MKRLCVCLVLAGLAAPDACATAQTPPDPVMVTAAPESLRTLARADLEAGRFSAAIDVYRRLLTAYPEDALAPEAWFSIAGIYAVFLQQPEAALENYRQLTDNYVETSPLVQRAYANMGKIYVELGRGDDAYRCFTSIAPGSAVYDESRSLASWMSTRFRRTLYWNGREALIIISVLEVAFVITWIFVGKVGTLGESLRSRLFWRLWALLLVFLALKSYFNYTLFSLG